MSRFSRELRGYLAAVERFPRLDREGELELARRYREGEQEAGRALAESHLRSVVSIARRHARGWVPLPELIAEGNVGLLEALRRFEPERGLRFLTYARHWIRAFILERLRRSRRAIELSLDTPAGDPAGGTWLDLLRAPGPDQEQQAASREERIRLRGVVCELWPDLDERERVLLTRRLLVPGGESLALVGRRFGLTRERARQIEVSLKEKLRDAYERSGAEAFQPL